MELRAGNVIATGTPEGVGIGMKPSTFFKGWGRDGSRN